MRQTGLAGTAMVPADMSPRLWLLLTLALTVAPALPQAASAQSPPDLRIAIPGDDGSLTPYTFQSGYAFMSLIYDTLTWRDASGIARPWLARSIRRSPDNLAVDVRLRQGVRWHDGTPLTADDVVFTYRFMAERPHPRFTVQLQDIRRVVATSGLSVRFELRRRSRGLEDQPMADVPILPRHLWQGLARNRRTPPGRAIGTGPFRLTSYRPRRGYRLEANKDYFRGAPSVARIEVPIIRREDDIVDELRRGRVDAVPLTIPPGSRPPSLPAVRFADDTSYTGTMLSFNLRRRPFNRLTARRAVARALDLDAIVGRSVGIKGAAVPATRGMLHPRSPWARVELRNEFDRAQARLAFAEQGIGSFRVAVPRNDPVRREIGERVVRALRDAGAAARLRTLSPVALDRALGRRNRPASYDVAVLGIPALASYDPAFLRAVFGDPATASLNDGGYRSDGFDRLAERVASVRTVGERRTAVKDQLRLLARELPALPLAFGGGTFAFKPSSYDRWVSVRGTGILDKRSFLQGSSGAEQVAGGAAPAADLLDRSGDDAGFSLVPVIVGFALLMGGLLAWALRRRRA